MAEHAERVDDAPVHDKLTEAELARLETIVRRAVRARVRDRATADDLTQEAMLRLLERDRDDIDDLDQYAATVAINLARRRWSDEARGQDVLPRVIDLRDPEVPDDVVVEADVAAALRGALDDLSPDRREALVAHEVGGASTAELASDGATPGAVAASLARTRARLRVGFLLRYRKIELTDPGCRPVLEAISANDTRRQRRLDADGHLEACPTCRSLAPALRERGAAWLGLSPGFGALLRRREVQVGAATVAVAAAVAAVALVRSGDGDTPRPPAEAAVSAPDPTAAEPATAPTTSPAPPASSPNAPDGSAAGTPPVVDPPLARAEPPARPATPPTPTPPTIPTVTIEAPSVHLPVEAPVVGEDLVLDHPVIEPLEPLVCPVLRLPVPVVSCSSDEPSDLAMTGP